MKRRKLFNVQRIDNMDKPCPEEANIRKRIYEMQVYRVRQDMLTLRNAIQAAESIINPTRYLLNQTYIQVVLDPHLSALMQSRKNKILCRKIKFFDLNGNENEDVLKLFKAAWFRKFTDLAMDSIFWGYSLIQFGPIVDDKFSDIELIPRQYVKPELGIVTSNYSLNTGTHYNVAPFNNWVIGVGQKRDLGLLMKAATPAIYKRNATAAWSEMAEVFGMPLRIGKTNVRDEETRAQMEAMFKNMSTATYGVFDRDDEVEFIETGKNDPFQIYNQLIERSNSEISKLIMGQTMTTDDGSSRSQAEVHEQVADEVGEADASFIQYVYNDQLLPMMRRNGFPIPEGGIEWDTTESLDVNSQFNIDIQLINSGKFKVDPKYITETYGTPVEESEQPEILKPDQGFQKKKSKAHLMSTIHNLYGEIGHICNKDDDFDQSPPLSFTDGERDDFAHKVYAGFVTTTNLSEQMYRKIAENLMAGVYEGFGKELYSVSFGAPDYEMLKALQKNVYAFSAAKTYQETKAISKKLLNSKGEKVPFNEFKKEADKIFDEYNVNFLKTEFISAHSQARMASYWLDIEKDKELFPYLKYKTVGDMRVRPDHAMLEGITKKVDDAFWKVYYPPNGWRCRCTVGQEQALGELKNIMNYSVEDVNPLFRFNAGREKKVFSPKHPYFRVGNKVRPFAKRNFGLPLP